MVNSPRFTLLQQHRLARPLVILLSVSTFISFLYLALAPTQHSHLVESIRVRWKLHGIVLKSGYLSRIPLDELVRLSHDIPRVRQSTIPQLIHQSYKDTTLPEDFKSYQKSWHAQHPSWIYQFWTDEVGLCMLVSLEGDAPPGATPPTAAMAPYACNLGATQDITNIAAFPLCWLD
jgi:mannosyltransferase OCH1-like enzyme